MEPHLNFIDEHSLPIAPGLQKFINDHVAEPTDKFVRDEQIKQQMQERNHQPVLSEDRDFIDWSDPEGWPQE